MTNTKFNSTINQWNMTKATFKTLSNLHKKVKSLGRKIEKSLDADGYYTCDMKDCEEYGQEIKELINELMDAANRKEITDFRFHPLKEELESKEYKIFL